jgi:hypothetical protein
LIIEVDSDHFVSFFLNLLADLLVSTFLAHRAGDIGFVRGRSALSFGPNKSSRRNVSISLA